HLAKGIETLGYIGIPKERLLVVLNRADSKVGLEPSDVERVMNIKIDAMIPSSRLVPASLNKGEPVYLSDPKSAVAQAITSLADRVAALHGAEVTDGDDSEEAGPEARKSRFRLGRS
ncbi:MAG TPA: hypothetical protein VFS18_02595, partial [Actinomycetota bacterium]|nr:hypothetical protein [Actinomycetota bacterium]